MHRDLAILFLLALFLSPALTARGQGLFNKKKKDAAPPPATSTTLFPSSSGYETSSSSPSAPGDNAIFRSGQPQEVKETSYIIRDGVKIEVPPTEPAPKRRALFNRGPRKENSSPPERPVPSANYPQPVANTGTRASSPNPFVPGASSPANRDKRIGPFLRFRRKDDPVSPYERTSPSQPAPAPAPIVGASGPSPVPAPIPPGAPAPAPGPTTFNPDPEAAAPSEKPSRFSRLPKIRRRKDNNNNSLTDPSRTEVLVNEGGSLVPIDDAGEEEIKLTDRAVVERVSNSGSSAPPRQEGGSRVYDSWEDVQGSQTSAADQIVRQMKAQEAAHKRKIAAAKREYEERVRKAEENARIQAIMQGGVLPPPVPPGSP